MSTYGREFRGDLRETLSDLRLTNGFHPFDLCSYTAVNQRQHALDSCENKRRCESEKVVMVIPAQRD
jgi:hypothetical protein